MHVLFYCLLYIKQIIFIRYDIQSNEFITHCSVLIINCFAFIHLYSLYEYSRMPHVILQYFASYEYVLILSHI